MKKETIFCMPSGYDKNSVFDIFKKMCGQDEIWIGGEPILITLNCRITDDTAKEKGLSNILNNNKKDYMESPVIQINHLEAFKQALFEYVEAYTKSNANWTKPDIARDWKEAAMYAMSFIWTDATRQDFEEPEAFLRRYTTFLTSDQWQDLCKPAKIKQLGETQLEKKVIEATEERETPYQYCLYIKNANGQEEHFPSVCYGIQGKTAYIYAIHQLHGKASQDNEAIREIRQKIKGRGVEPLGIAAVLSFIEEAKQRGIEKIVMPDFFVMQYSTKKKMCDIIVERIERNLHYQLKRKLQDYSIQGEQEQEKIIKKILESVEDGNRGEDEIEFVVNDKNKTQELMKIATEGIQYINERKGDEKLDNILRHTVNDKMMTLSLISRYYSTGIEFLEIPGEVSDNLVADIRNFKIGRKQLQALDRRRKGIEEEGR